MHGSRAHGHRGEAAGRGVRGQIVEGHEAAREAPEGWQEHHTLKGQRGKGAKGKGAPARFTEAVQRIGPFHVILSVALGILQLGMFHISQPLVS